MIPHEPPRDAGRRRPARPLPSLQWWMVGRVMVATLMLGGILLLTTEGRAYGSFTPSVMVGLIVAIYTSSIFFGAALLRGVFGRSSAASVLMLDVAAIATLTWLTGGALSMFTVLFGVTVIVAAMTTGARMAWVTAATSLVAYTALAVGTAGGWLPYPPDQVVYMYGLDTAEVGFALLSHTAGLLIIPGLASHLAERLTQTGGELRMATESAARLAQLNDDIVRCISSGLITVDAAGLVHTVNPAAAEMLGGPVEALRSEPIVRFFPALAWQGHEHAPRRAETEGRRLDEAPFPAGYTSSALVDLEGKRNGILLSFQDLTEIHRLRHRALQEERLAALGRLAAGLAHEIRNPLSSISGSVELVRESPALGSEDAHLLGIVSEEVERLNGLVDTMLRFARPREPRPARTELGKLLEDVATMARSMPSARETVAIAIDVEGPVHAEVDADQLRQVIWNLLKNGIQVSPPGGEVTLRARVVSEQILLEVEDDGPGLGEATQEHLFDAFFTTRTHGVGLGLAIVRQIVEAHGGVVEAENGPQGGAVFRVLLPVLAPPLE